MTSNVWINHPIFHDKRYLILGLIISQLLLCILAWNVHQIQVINDATTRYIHRLEKLQGTIIHLDEVLSMSAHMAATTGGGAWEARYVKHEPELNQAIEEAIKLLSKVDIIEVASQINEVNSKLVKIEKQAFALVNKGELTKAQDLLFSPQYKMLKKLYAYDMVKLTNHINNTTLNQLLSRDDMVRVIYIIITSLFLLLLFYWFGVFRALQQIKSKLETSKSAQSTELKLLNQNLQANQRLLESIRSAQSNFIHNIDAKIVFNKLLDDVLLITSSEYGFIGEAHVDKSGNPYLKTHAITDISWNDESRKFYEENAPTGLEFVNLKSLFGVVLTSKKLVISNDPANDPRRCGIPKGHPALNSFVGIPLQFGGQMVGMLGIANRPGGYDEDLVQYLQPLISTLANLIDAWRTSVDRTKLITDLKVAKIEAEDSNKAKSEFLAVMSHEIRTPLNAILGMTEVVKELNSDTNQERYLQVIEKSGHNLLSLIEDILDLSHIEAGQITLENKLIDLNDIAKDAIDIHSQVAENKGLYLYFDISSEVPKKIQGDQKRLRQVLLNILGNAVKFTDKGTVELRVSCPSQNTVQFSVKDSGPGIPEDKHVLIFEPFSQVDSSNTRRHGGVGLGLAICKRLVDVMKGKIWVESGYNKGSVFHVSIPIIDENVQNELELHKESSKEENIKQKDRPTTILLAEDVIENAIVIEAFLFQTLNHLEIVEDGLQAVQKIQSGNRYDLILMDIQMPVMDGLEATRQIRAWEKEEGYARTPILALTAHAMEGDTELSLAAGCDIHITKPISKHMLLDYIEEYKK
ncbi:MAG: GAF domain-containing protein [Magnetococcales bacterium]|nr:GAF domain-containing protein [Magnetococcales bacterium]